MVSCSVVTDAEALASLASPWSDLLERSDSNEPTLSPLWLLTWWGIFGGQDGRSLRVVVFHEGDRLVGLAPILSRRHWYHSAIPFRRLEFLASGENEADEICSEYLNVIAERGCEDAVAQELARLLTDGGLGPWDEIVLPVMNSESRMPEALSRALQRPGSSVLLSPAGAAPYISLPPTWDEYVASLSKKQRYNLKSAERDFEGWAEGTARLETVQSLERLAEGREILHTLHGERWQATGESGAFASKSFRDFHDTIMPKLLAMKALDLTWLTVRGEPVAAQYNIVWNGKVYFYQSARKVDVPKRVRPGIVILAHVIRRSIEAGLREYDFLGGTHLYKRQLTSIARPLTQLRVSRGGLRELFRRAAEAAKGQARSLLASRTAPQE